MKKDLDRIYEVYVDDSESDFSIKTKQRIEWICNQVKGNLILDVGCSQGIVPILLAKQGKRVIGLDIEQEAIDFANSKKLLEEDSVQKNVSFVCGDFQQYDFEGKVFDTVILTEVLEHIVDVDNFINCVKYCIHDDSQIIITVPFGINDHWDHKRTYYYGGLYKQLKDFYQVDDVQFMGRWLGLVCTPKSQETVYDNKKIELELMLEEEEGFFAIERKLTDDRNAFKQRVVELREAWNTEKSKVDGLKERIDELESITDEIERLRKHNIVLEEQKEKLRVKNQTLEEQKEKLKVRNQTLEEQKEKLRVRNQTLEEQKEKLNVRNGLLEEQKKKQAVRIERINEQNKNLQSILKTKESEYDMLANSFFGKLALKSMRKK